MAAAVVAIPMLIAGLGTERFGVLTLAWMTVGYFSLFDLGLGRALTKLVAEKLGEGLEAELPALAYTALALMGVLGLSGAAVVAGVSHTLVYRALNIPTYLQAETLHSFYLLAFSLPVVIGTAGLRGLLEAYQRFDLVNAVRIPMGIFTFLGPLTVLPFTSSLFPVVGVLVAGRLLAYGVHLWLCLRFVPALRKGLKVKRELVRPLIGFGGWMTVSNIVGPVLLYLDRFLIASFVSVTAVTYYTTPYEVITKLRIVPAAIIGVLFPAFSFSFARDTERVKYLYRQAMKYVFLVLLPVAILIVLLAKDALAAWLNQEFASNSFRVAQLLVIGVVVNSLGLVSQSLIQASGRPDLTAKLHLVELPLYLVYLWWFLHMYGINGAAFAWVVRVTISAMVLAFLARRSISGSPNPGIQSGSQRNRLRERYETPRR